MTNEDEASVFCEADIKYTETSLAVASPTERQKKAAENLVSDRLRDIFGASCAFTVTLRWQGKNSL